MKRRWLRNLSIVSVLGTALACSTATHTCVGCGNLPEGSHVVVEGSDGISNIYTVDADGCVSFETDQPCEGFRTIAAGLE